MSAANSHPPVPTGRLPPPVSQVHPSAVPSLFRTTTQYFVQLFHRMKINLDFNKQSSHQLRIISPKIEDARQGYPRFSALMASHPSFMATRRFSAARMRLLLYKQDEISILEDELKRVDEVESCEIFLGSSRRDKNQDRKTIINNLAVALEEYDGQVERLHMISSLDTPRPRDIESLVNWVEGNGSISKKETAFLRKENDLMSIAGIGDPVVTYLEAFLEKLVFAIFRRLRYKSKKELSTDPNVHVLPNTALRMCSKCLIVSAAVALLLLPIIILHSLKSVPMKFVVILLVSIAFTLLASVFGRATTIQIFMVSASYAAVMVVFIAGDQTTLSK